MSKILFVGWFTWLSMLWSVIPYYNLVSCGGSSNKNVAGTERGRWNNGTKLSEDDGVLFCYSILPRGNVQLIGSIDTSD